MLGVVVLVLGCDEDASEAKKKADATAEALPPSPNAGEKGMRPLGNFEGGETEGWTGSDGATVEVSSEHPSVGKKSLRVTLPKTAYPGFGRVFGKDDWSGYDALRFSVYNAGRKALKLCIRIDGADSTGYGTRFNLEGGQTFDLPALASTEVDLDIAALSVGTLESQGLDVRAIRELRFFVTGLTQPTTLYVDAFRLVQPPRTPPDVVPIAVLDDPQTWQAAKGTVATVTGKQLKLELTPEGTYPGVAFIKLPRNWPTFDLLAFDVVCPEDAATPGGIAVKLVEKSGRSRTCATGLSKGINHVKFPLELGAQLRMGSISSVQLFMGKPDETQTILITAPRLVRVRELLQAPVHAPEGKDTQLTLDFTEAGAGGKNSCWGATVRIPRKDGTQAVVFCSSPGKKQLKYAVPASMFADYDANSPVTVWAYFFDHGQWGWGHKEIKVQAGLPAVLKFADRRNLSK